MRMKLNPTNAIVEDFKMERIENKLEKSITDKKKSVFLCNFPFINFDLEIVFIITILYVVNKQLNYHLYEQQHYNWICCVYILENYCHHLYWFVIQSSNQSPNQYISIIVIG